MAAPWLYRTEYVLPDPAKPEQYEYRIIMAVEIDDGFGGKTVAYKPFDMAMAAEAGFELPKVIADLNIQILASNDTLKQGMAALEAAYNDLTVTNQRIVEEANALVSSLKDQLDERNQKVAELTAIINPEGK